MEYFNPFYDAGGVFDTVFYHRLFWQVLKHVQEGSKIFQIDVDEWVEFEHVYLTLPNPDKRIHILNRDRLSKTYLKWFFSNQDLPNNLKARVVYSKWFKLHGVLEETENTFEILEIVILDEVNEESKQ